MDSSVKTPWERAKRLLRPIQDADLDDVLQRLLDSRAQLWAGENCAVVTEVTDENFLHLWLAGGDMRKLKEILPAGEDFAKFMGCRGMEIDGRKGWLRVMQQFGFIPCGGNVLRKYYGNG